ncbi:hypothetical protein RYX36_001609, partial [Vicia faba]
MKLFTFGIIHFCRSSMSCNTIVTMLYKGSIGKGIKCEIEITYGGTCFSVCLMKLDQLKALLKKLKSWHRSIGTDNEFFFRSKITFAKCCLSVSASDDPKSFISN